MPDLDTRHPGPARRTTTGPHRTAYRGPNATLLLDGSVLATGGSAARSAVGANAERHDPDNGARRTAPAMPDARKATIPAPRTAGVSPVVGGIAPVAAADDPATHRLVALPTEPPTTVSAEDIGSDLTA